MSVFEIIDEIPSDEKIPSDSSPESPGTVREGAPTAITLPHDLTYCAFCKGYYNEYHFGDIDVQDSV
jgi:hypothetical protein